MGKKILVVGSGGREAALVQKLCESESIKLIYCAPGSDSIGKLDARVHCVFRNDDADKHTLCEFAKEKGIDLTIVGPEAPLVDGIVDVFMAKHLRIVGPTEEAARLEGSKAFCKKLLRAHNISTPDFEIFNDPSQAKAYINRQPVPVVVKADGLAGGKGVFVARTRPEGRQAIDTIMVERKFGEEAGRCVVIENFLQGVECSVMALSDGRSLLPLPPVQDYKRAGDNNTGVNTGGMGSIAPLPAALGTMRKKILSEILYPTISALRSRGTPYRGILYAGLMISQGEPYVLEFNCRFGDPELQVLLCLLESDLMSLLEATVNGAVKDLCQLGGMPRWRSDRRAVCLVLASDGYPEKYQVALPIDGLEEARPFVHVIHAGTKWCRDREQWLTNGGRVLNLVAIAPTFPEARRRVYAAAECITFGGRRPQYRTDIAADVTEEIP